LFRLEFYFFDEADEKIVKFSVAYEHYRHSNSLSNSDF
jgi:hypothetical protein